MCSGPACFTSGDERLNEQPYLTLFHTIFHREHNRIATELHKLNGKWDDEKLYQESRRILIAEWQHIIYNEYLPNLLGRKFMTSFGLWPLNKGHSGAYRDDFDPRIINEFATAAFRMGHSQITTFIRSVNRAGKMFNTRLSDLFTIVDGLTRKDGVEALIRGMTSMAVQNTENSFTKEITDRLFDGDAQSMDLIALNIQRGRDHGIPGYVEYRKLCRVGDAKNFDDLRSNMNQEVIEALKKLYKRVEDVDLFVGLLMEKPGFKESIVGPTLLCIMGDQFSRLKKV